MLNDLCKCLFFFNDTATTEIYTLSLHDALPILTVEAEEQLRRLLRSKYDSEDLKAFVQLQVAAMEGHIRLESRSEEHTSELQSRQYLVCRLLLEKKKPSASTLLPNTGGNWRRSI